MATVNRSTVVIPAVGVRSVAASSGKRLAPLVYDMIKERLLEGRYEAGGKLQVEALRTEFGVSKQPVMDALRRLASDGLVEIIPQVGCRVPAFGPTDVVDFFAIFGGMEGAFAGVAAQRFAAPQLSSLRATNEEIRRLSEHADAAIRAHGYRVLNRKFHAIIHDMTHSPVVTEISQRMWDMSDLLINTAGIPQPLASAVTERYEDHEQIIAALQDRDQGAARTAMEEHIVGTVDVMATESRAVDARNIP